VNWISILRKTARRWSPARSRPAPTLSFGHPLAAITPEKFARLRRLISIWAHEHEPDPSQGIRIDAVAVTASTSGAHFDRARARGGLMFARTSTVALVGAVGHVIDVQVDVSAWGGRRQGRRPTRHLDQRIAGALPQQRWRTCQPALAQ
jgi:Holliday junction resolvase-like predicted endonuclease